MKKIIITLIISSAFILSTEAQNKFGYINSNELLSMMPETKEKQEEYQIHGKNLESNLIAMQVEYEKMVVEFQQNETSYTDIIKEDKIRQIENIQQRIVDFQKSAQETLAQKELELFQPIKDKAMAAINEVAKNENYTFIFDEAAGGFLYADESENIIELVKAKLGL